MPSPPHTSLPGPPSPPTRKGLLKLLIEILNEELRFRPMCRYIDLEEYKKGSPVSKVTCQKAAPKKAAFQNGRESTNKKLPIPSNSVIGRIATVFGTAVLGAAFRG